MLGGCKDVSILGPQALDGERAAFWASPAHFVPVAKAVRPALLPRQKCVNALQVRVQRMTNLTQYTMWTGPWDHFSEFANFFGIPYRWKPLLYRIEQIQLSKYHYTVTVTNSAIKALWGGLTCPSNRQTDQQRKWIIQGSNHMISPCLGMAEKINKSEVRQTGITPTVTTR